MNVTRRLCFVHSHREAVARCRSCGRSFCRECVTEHDGVIRCAKCVRIEIPSARSSSKGMEYATLAAIAIVSTLLALLTVAFLTDHLGSLPSSFHDGSIWK